MNYKAIVAIADRMNITHQEAAQVVNTLQEKGLIDEEGFLTDYGEECQGVYVQCHIVQRFFPKLSYAEAYALFHRVMYILSVVVGLIAGVLIYYGGYYLWKG